MIRPRMGTWTQGSQFSGEIGHELAWKDEPGQPDYLSWEFELENMESPNQLSAGHSSSKGRIIARKAGGAAMSHE